MIKRIFALGILFLIVTLYCTAEDAPTLSLQSKKLLVHNDSTFMQYKFYSEENNEKVIKQRELYKILRTAPGNEKTIKVARRWEIANFVSLGLLGFSTGIFIAQKTTGSNNEDIVELSSAGVLTGILCSCATFTVHLGAMSNAVDNYNLYVMGIPIK